MTRSSSARITTHAGAEAARDLHDRQDLMVRVRWTACTATRGARELALVVELRTNGEADRGVLDAWLDTTDGTRVLCRAAAVEIRRLDDGPHVHVDACADGHRLLALSVAGNRLAFARTAILERTGTGPGAFDPPALELCAFGGIDVASA